MAAIDPYEKWLGIPAHEQPPSHYRLLGIEEFEDEPSVIGAAADRQMAFLRQQSRGPHARTAERVLNELAAARVCLLSPAKKQRYDAELRATLAERHRNQSWLKSLPQQLRNPAFSAGIAAVCVFLIIGAAILLWPRTKRQPAQVPIRTVVDSDEAGRDSRVATSPTADAVPADVPLPVAPPVGPASPPPSPRDAPFVAAADPAVDEAPESEAPSAKPAQPDAKEGAPAAKPAPAPAVPAPADQQPATSPPVAVTPPGAKGSKHQVPSERELVGPKQNIIEFYRYEAHTDAYLSQAELKIQDLLEHAQTPNQSPATRCALLLAAEDLAVAVHNVRLLSHVAVTMAEYFEVSPTAEKTAALIRFVETKRPYQSDDDRLMFFEAAAEVLDEAIENNEVEEAARSLPKFNEAAQKITTGRNTPSRKRFESRAVELKKLAEQTEGIAAARSTLKDSPDDPNANARVGRYLCFVTGRWDDGLPLLAKGDDRKLAEIARDDLAGADDPKQQLRLGDNWWTVAQTESGLLRSRIQARAGEWYHKAEPGLPAAAQKRLKKRLEVVEEFAASRRPLQKPQTQNLDPDAELSPIRFEYARERQVAEQLQQHGATELVLCTINGKVDAIRDGKPLGLPAERFRIDSFTAGRGFTDAGLKDFDRLGALRAAIFVDSDVTDQGLAGLTGPRCPAELTIVGSNKFTGAGLREFADGIQELSLAFRFRALTLNSVPQTDQFLKAATKLHGLRDLMIEGDQPVTIGLGDLSLLKDLSGIRFVGTPLTGSVVEELGRCRQIWYLSFTRVSMEPKVLGALRTVSKLSTLKLREMDLSGDHIKSLVEARPNLEALVLTGSNFPPGTLRELSRMRELGELDVENTPASDADFTEVFPALYSLDVSNTAVTGAGFQGKALFPKLRGFKAEHSKLTDEGLQALAASTPDLRLIDISGTAVTPTGISALTQCMHLKTVRFLGIQEPDKALLELVPIKTLKSVVGNFSKDTVQEYQSRRKQLHGE